MNIICNFQIKSSFVSTKAKVDPRIDAYIKKSAPFAQPVLNHLRKIVHKGCPGVEETIKWSFPHFQYYGAVLCSMAAFKEHCAFGFWKASLMKDPKGILQLKHRTAMGNMDRIQSVKDLPAEKILIVYVQEAARLNEEGIKKPAKKKSTVSQKDLEIPDELTKAFSKNRKAPLALDALPPSHRKEYIQWIQEAKTEPTRDKRIKNTIELVSEGKSRYWKYNRQS